ncbi:MAG TPA: Tn3 family transposase [Actinoallomurus sp.]|nr:Tn3 family transposase [Actinoallomurus sp.]
MQHFIELLLEVIGFRAVEAGAPVVAMVRAAAAMAKARRRYDRADVAADEELITGSWRPLVFANPDLPAGQIDKAAFTLCALMHLHAALRRRDVFAVGVDRWSDPRARLLEGPGWQAARPQVLEALELEQEPAGHLAELSSALEDAYTRVLDGLGGNTAVQFVGGRLQVDKLGPLAEPPLMTEFRALIGQMLPRVDFPELLLEVFDRTGLADEFTHISGADPAMEDFAVRLCGLVVAEACNVGLVPIEKRPDLALQRVSERHRPFMGRASRQKPVHRSVRVKTVQRHPLSGRQAGHQRRHLPDQPDRPRRTPRPRSRRRGQPQARSEHGHRPTPGPGCQRPVGSAPHVCGDSRHQGDGVMIEEQPGDQVAA